MSGPVYTAQRLKSAAAPTRRAYYIELERFEGDEAEREATRRARDESGRRPGPVEVWHEGPTGPSWRATYVAGERTE